MFSDYNPIHNEFDRLRQFAERHRRGRGFGGFGAEMGFGGGPFRFGRKFASGDLQLLILALLAEKPRHGYELIKALEEQSGGFYSPSPGMVYPALAYLEEIGHATAVPEGTKKLYHISDSGREHLEAHRAEIDQVFDELRLIGERMKHFRRAFSGREMDEEDEGFPFERGSQEFKEARRALKSALHQVRGASAEESKRIADILLRAAAEILRERR